MKKVAMKKGGCCVIVSTIIVTVGLLYLLRTKKLGIFGTGGRGMKGGFQLSETWYKTIGWILGSSVNYHLFTRSDFEMLFLNYLANFVNYIYLMTVMFGFGRTLSIKVNKWNKMFIFHKCIKLSYVYSLINWKVR